MDAAALPIPVTRRASASKRLLALRGDTALVERMRGGDAVAFEVLYERHVGAILSFCRHMLGSPDEAEDAVQQVFISAHRHLVGDTRAINVKPWLYAIARNRCLSMLRARSEETSEEVEVSTRGLDEVVQQRADLRSLLADIADLPEEQRAALVLTELGDLSHAEVGQVLGCGEGQVKGFVFRARSGLAERREAREAGCEEIRAELASARGGGFRRGRLSHHLKACPGCTEFLADLRRQRKMMGLILPVIPSIGLKDSVLGALAAGGGGAAGGGAVAAGGAAATAAGFTASAGGAGSVAALSVAKIAAVGVLAGGAGVAVVATDHGRDAAAPDARDAGPRAPGPAGADRIQALREARAPAEPAAGLGGRPTTDRSGDPAGGRGSQTAEPAEGPGPGLARGRGRGRGGGLDRAQGNGRGATAKPETPPGQSMPRGTNPAARGRNETPRVPRGRQDAPPAGARGPAEKTESVPRKKLSPPVAKAPPGQAGKPAK